MRESASKGNMRKLNRDEDNKRLRKRQPPRKSAREKNKKNTNWSRKRVQAVITMLPKRVRTTDHDITFILKHLVRLVSYYGLRLKLMRIRLI